MRSRHARQTQPVLRRVRGGAAALVAAVVVALLAPAPGAGAPPPRRFVYAGDRDFPPYEFLDSAGRPSGLNVELIRAVAKAQGLEVEIRLEPWVQVRKDLASGAADVAAMYRTEHRVREVDFAIPHEVVYHEMFVRAGAAPLTGVGDLTGKKVLYQGGSYPEDALAALSCRCTPIPAATERGALEALARGEGDVAVVSQAMRRPFVDRKELGRAVVQTGPPILVAEYAFVTAKGREPLVETLNLGLAAVKASGEYERIHARWLRADRFTGWLKWIAGALLVAIGGLTVVVAWNHDLRRRVAIQTDALRREFEDRERAQAALAESERSLRGAQKLEALGRMAGAIAHDFNNVLSVVSSSGTVLRDDLVARGEATEDVDEILSAVERASRLVRQLLAFGRATPLVLARLDLGEVVLGMKSLIQRLTGDRVRVEVEVPDAPVFVDAETSFVEQVLLNLTANARDAMGGSGTLEVTLGTRTVREGEHPGLPAGAYASLTVSDTGVGMDEATASRVFEPFFTTKPVGRGTGLGLSTVFAVVSRMNGRVTVESAPGCGTTFEVLLPLAAPEEVGDRGGAASRAEVPVAPAQDILLVEDDDSLRRAAAVALRRAGHRVQEAGDGASALALAAKHAPTLVVSDVVLPGRTGPSVVAELRARNPGLPVLFTSGYVQEGVELPLDAPGTAFLAKPYSGPVLVEAVRRLLSRDTAPAANA